MENNLIEAFRKHFCHHDTIHVGDVFRFYSEQNPDILQTTVNWRIHTLEREGIIKRIGRGVYRLGKSNLFQTDLSAQLKKTARIVKKEFPYTDFCVWELGAINIFSHNLINFNLFFIDVERDAVDAIYYRLKEKQKSVVHIRKTNEDISDIAGSICIRPLVSHAPIQNQEQIPVATLEKLLVDWATDKEFFPFKENEIISIYGSAFEKYTINRSSMLRYAARKAKRNTIEEIFNFIHQ